MVALCQHVERIVPDALHVHIPKIFSFQELCAEVLVDFVQAMNKVGLVASETAGARQIMFRKVQFAAKQTRFISRVFPYTACPYLLSVQKANLQLDEQEYFTVSDQEIRSKVMQSECNGAYFLPKRCEACGGGIELEQEGHNCDFFCVAACELHDQHPTKEKTRMMLVYVEYKIAAVRLECQSSVPCVRLHVLSPTRLFSACYAGINTLECILSVTNKVGCQCGGQGGVLCPVHVVVPCPMFLKTMPVNVLSLRILIHFYKENVLSTWYNEKKTDAVVEILFLVGEYVLKTAVLKPMIIPFVSEDIKNPNVNFFFVKTPMRDITTAMQQTRLFLRSISPPVTQTYEQLVASFCEFMSHTGASHKHLEGMLKRWTPEYAVAFATKNDAQRLMMKSTAPKDAHTGLEGLLDALRCFFYTQQAGFYTDTLHIEDVTVFSRLCKEELELRFLFLLFQKGLSRPKITFARGDVCNILHLP